MYCKDKGYSFNSNSYEINEFDLLQENCIFILEFDYLVKFDNLHSFPSRIRDVLIEINKNSSFIIPDNSDEIIMEFISEKFTCSLIRTLNGEIIVRRNNKQLIFNLLEDLSNGMSTISFDDRDNSKIRVIIGLLKDSLDIAVYSTAYNQLKNLYYVNPGSDIVHKSIRDDNFKLDKSIINLIRKNAVDMRITYKNEEEFISNVKKIFSHLNLSINNNTSNFAWDENFSKPKHEIDIAPTLYILILSLCEKAGLEINYEVGCTSGRIDLLVSGMIEKIGICNICIEIKKAHSSNLEHGLLSQLPEYMDKKGAIYGIYLILWFGNEEAIYSRFSGYKDLNSMLKTKKFDSKYKNFLRDIDIFSLDVSIPISASKK